jgi:hypothetical protein
MSDLRSRGTAFRTVLLGVDALLIALHVVHRLASHTFFAGPAFDLTGDYGLSELFSYVKLLATVFLLVRVARQDHRPALLAWAAVFGYLLLDDLVRFHERTGEGVVSLLHDDPDRYLVGGMRTQDLGEIAILVAVGLPLLTILAVNYVRGSAASRRTDRTFAVLLIVMTGFAVVVDLVADVFTANAVRFVLTLIEDGGELVMLSLIASYAFSLAGYDEPHGEEKLPGRRRFRHR